MQAHGDSNERARAGCRGRREEPGEFSDRRNSLERIEIMNARRDFQDHRIAKNILAGAVALVVLASSGIGPSPARAASPKPRSPAEIAEASRLLAVKNETCRQEAKAQHLHLLKRRRFMRECRSRS